MQFNSFEYILFFLPISFVLYSLFRTSVASKWILFIGSCLFYGWLYPWFLLPMFATAMLDYVIARKIGKTENDKKRRQYLTFAVVSNLLLMCSFKYTTWMSENIMLLGEMVGLSLLTAPILVPLPPGISFYTFESISYSVDVYRREVKPRQSILDYLSFIVFFPHLVAGPIRRAKDLLPRLSEYRAPIDAKTASQAMFFIFWGLLLKVVCADNLGSIVEIIEEYAKSNTMPSGAGLVYTYSFAYQIYCDFAAYSLIARGSALLFNIDVSRNFLTPYFAQNPSDFWQRWNISLSRWLRDYLYIPLGGNKFGRFNTLRNLMITMFLGGVWHGAGIFFVAWGCWHGLLLLIYRVFAIDLFLEKKLGIVGKVIAIIILFHLICFGWLLFRSSPSTIGPLVQSILALRPAHFNPSSPQWLFPYGSQMAVLSWTMFVYILPVIITDSIGYWNKCEFVELWDTFTSVTKPFILIITFYIIVFFASRQASEFIYFSF